ncbi:MAG: Na+ dependent nucleoside transporter, partial [Saprospiraceae bacterium]|nr:Na+ dependent nucleoside transporter [Saprospiraceae bacterium]
MELLNNILRGTLGVAFLLGMAWLLSNNRRAINWRLVGAGMALQVVFALGVLKVPIVNKAFDAVASFFVVVLDFTKAGSAFLFGNIIERTDTFGYIFAFQVLPTVVFFSALS